MTSTPPTFDPALPWQMHPRVALRPEPFGAMAYHYGNRRLNFLRHPDLVRVVEALHTWPDVNAALAGEGIAEPRRPGFLKALARLAASDFLTRRDPNPSPDA